MTDKRSFPVPTQTEIDLFCEAAHTEGFAAVRSFIDRYGPAIDAKNRFDNTALMLASSIGNHDMAELLLEKGANMDVKDIDGRTALFWAKEYRHKDVIVLLETWPQVQKQRRQAALTDTHLQNLRRLRSAAKPSLKKKI